MREAVIVSTARTGLAKSGRGGFNDTHGATMTGHAIKHAVERAKIDPAMIEDVVIGCGASAIQFIPEIAPRVAELKILQRTPPWVLPRPDFAIAPGWQHALARLPPLRLALRGAIFLWFEILSSALLSRRSAVWARWIARRHLKGQIADSALRERLTPDYPIGAKRVLFNDDYYPALTRRNVELVTDGVEEILPQGIRTRAGSTIPADVIVYATGFKSTEFLAPMRVTGAAGRDLQAEWSGGARAYLGVTVSGFPNFFILYGPNTNLGHNSILVMIEAQVGYVIDLVRKLQARGLKRADVRRTVMDEYNRGLQQDLAKSVWATIGASWYKLADGTITNNWPHSTIRYQKLLREARLEDYET